MKNVKKLTIFVIVILCFIFGISNVSAKKVSGGTENGDQNGINSSGGKCLALNDKYHICMFSGKFLGYRLSLVYYDGQNYSLVDGSRYYYVAGTDKVRDKFNEGWKTIDGTSLKITDSSASEYINSWTKKEGNKLVYNKQAVMSSMGTSEDASKAINSSDLNKWLKKLSKNQREPIKVASLTNESCAVDKYGNDNKCKNAKGYRIIIEPLLIGYNKNNSDVTVSTTFGNENKKINKGAYRIWTVKELAGASGSDKIADKTWDDYSHLLYTDFKDIGISAGKEKKKNYRACASNKKCGLGYHIIDIGVNNPPPPPSSDKCEINKNPSSDDIKNDTKCIIYEYDNNNKIKNKATAPHITCYETLKSGRKVSRKTYNGKNVNCPFTDENPKYECQPDVIYGNCNAVDIDSGIEVVSSFECNDNRTSVTDDGVTYTFERGKECPFKEKHNYDIDIACSGCDDNDTKDNLSYYIQDTVNWNAILHSKQRNDNTNLADYFATDDTEKIWCRNEYGVSMPKQSSIITVPGRYFTVNLPGGNLVNEIYNFKPIKVTRIRECISATSDKGLLDSYGNSSKITDFGDIKLYYKDNDNPKYETTQNLVNEKRRISSVEYDNSKAPTGYILRRDEATAYYELNDDVYRYIAVGKITIGDKTFEPGESSKTKPIVSADILNNKFRNVGVPNLPVSINNTKGAVVSLNYQLSDDSDIKEIASNGVNSLEDKATNKNIYSDANLVKQSACAKMYELNTSKYNACVSDRTQPNTNTYKNNGDAITECLNAVTNSDNFKNYICNLKSTNGCVPNSCYQILSTDSETKYYCSDANKNNGLSYQCSADEYFNLCGGDNGEEHVCVIHDGKYYGQDGKQIIGDNAALKYEQQCARTEEICKRDCKAGFCCPGSNMTCPMKTDDGWTCTVSNSCGPGTGECNLEYMEKKMKQKHGDKWDGKRFSCIEAGYCCDDIEMGCPACYKENADGTCGEWACPPGGWGKEIIYRTIDLNNPFPGQQAQGRNAGANWCSKNLITGELSCDNENDVKATDNSSPNNYATNVTDTENIVVGNKIKNNRSKQRNDIYTQDPMYVFKLNSQKIKEIRDYNKGKDYNDVDALTYSKENDTYVSMLFKSGNSSSAKINGILDSGTCSTYNVLVRDTTYNNIKCQMEGVNNE